jgi:nicotinamidase-related amidase
MEALPLLVVIDMQEVFRDPESPWATPGFEALAKPIGRLVDAFGQRVVHTRFVLPERLVGSWSPYYATWAEVTKPERSDWFELAEPYRSWASATVDKPTFSAWGSALAWAAGDPATIVLCGVATDCCVISTALAAVDSGAFVRVVSDACAGSTGAAHEAALAVMRGYVRQIEVTTVEEQVELVRSVRAS